MLKILQARLQQYLNHELPNVQARFRKGRGIRDQISNIIDPFRWLIKNTREFQRITRRDKKTFLGDQCKEVEKNNRMGKIGDLLKKIRDTKGTFHVKMDTIKDRNDVDLTEAKDTKWQEYKELYKTDLHDPDNHDGVITHIEPEILE